MSVSVFGNFLVSDEISPGRAAVGGPDDSGHVVKEDPGHVGVELEGLIGDQLALRGLVPLLVQFPKLIIIIIVVINTIIIIVLIIKVMITITM